MSEMLKGWALIRPDYYHTLGIQLDATNAEIEAAFESLIVQVNASKMSRITAQLMGQSPERLAKARDVLLSTELRAKYDIQMKNWSTLCGHGMP